MKCERDNILRTPLARVMEENKKDVKCSLCIALDNDTLKRAKLIQELRKKNDNNFDLWMPRLNLLHPFIPEDEFQKNLPKLEIALAEIEPFDLVFDRFDFFDRKKGTMIYLAPSEQVISSYFFSSNLIILECREVKNITKKM